MKSYFNGTFTFLIFILLIIFTGCSFPKIYKGLEPIKPALGYSIDKSYPTIESLQPEICWKEEAGYSYDLCIFESPDQDYVSLNQKSESLPSDIFYPGATQQKSWGKVVYCVEDIQENHHIVATPLKPSTIYTWSVRLRQGQKCSKWSYFIQHVYLRGRYYNVPYGFATPPVN